MGDVERQWVEKLRGVVGDENVAKSIERFIERLHGAGIEFDESNLIIDPFEVNVTNFEISGAETDRIVYQLREKGISNLDIEMIIFRLRGNTLSSIGELSGIELPEHRVHSRLETVLKNLRFQH